MADTASSTPPPGQEPSTRPVSFDATWEQADASFLKPASIPLAKPHRAWERQPHSPFARNGRYRKVWRRYDLRSQPQTKASATTADKKDAMKSPRKVVKKRALDAPADPNATPGRKGTKNKAFAPTRWETPRRYSGRIASRKIAQPMFVKEPTPESLHNEDKSASAQDGTPEICEEEDLAEEATEDPQSQEAQEDGQDHVMVEAAEDSISPAEQLIPAETEDAVFSPTASRATKVQEDAFALEQTVRSPIPKDEPKLECASVEQIDGPRLEAEPTEGSVPDEFQTPTPPAIVHDSPSVVFELAAAASEGVDAAQDKQEEQVDAPLGEQETVPATLDSAEAAVVENTAEDGKLSEHPDGKETDVHSADGDITMEDQVEKHLSEAEDQEELTNDAGIAGVETDNAQSSVAQPVTDFVFTIDEPAAPSGSSPGAEEKIELQETVELGSASALEDDEASLSDEDMDETENFDENGMTLTDVQEELDDTVTNLPSPSLSVAESPRFSAIADTLTLNLPDRTPPKNRTTKEIPEEPASPTDADTAFLREFLSRADASKASREANVSRLESMTNRRDSDMVRHALASPRFALESKDPNSPNLANNGSPVKKGKATETDDSVFSLGSKKSDPAESIAADLSLEAPAPEPTQPAEEQPSKPQNTRRSSRARTTRAPATSAASKSSAPGPNRIQFRRANGTEPVVLKKTEAQELAALTRNNTRRNKGTALAAPIRLNKLKAELFKAAPDTASPSSSADSLPVYADPSVEVFAASRLRWDQQLVYFQEQQNLATAALTSLSDDELAGGPTLGSSDSSSSNKKEQEKDKSATPARTKRARGLGAGNGTPAKGLLAPASLLPAEVQAEAQAEAAAPASKSSSKKSSSSSKAGGSRTSKKAEKDAAAKATDAAPAPPAESSSILPTPAPAASSTSPPNEKDAQQQQQQQQQQQATSQLPAPSSATAPSRRSRLQTPRKVKLPVPVSTAASATPAAPPASEQAPATNRIVGSTPKKMGIPKPAPPTSFAGAAADGQHGMNFGLSVAGRRRAAAGRRGA